MPTNINYQIVRTRRRSISLIINNESRLIIRAPFRVSEDYIKDLITRKMKWIQKKLAEMALRPKLIKPDKSTVVFYKERAKKNIIPRAQFLADQFGFAPSRIRISGAMHRWGSCNSRGRISLSWRLVMTPQEVIDYVIIHELSHLVHLNHSKRFWEKVKAILPDYKERIKWLKQNENLLNY